jgi:hypothetical protein
MRNNPEADALYIELRHATPTAWGEAWGTSTSICETFTTPMHRASASRTSPAVSLWVIAPALPDHGEIGLNEGMDSRDARIHLAELSTSSCASRDRLAAGQTRAKETARADGPSGRVYSELWDAKGWPASAARRSRVMTRQTVRAEWG